MELTFAFPALLWALPVAALPIVFHVRSRVRERTVDFPGAFFLERPALPSAERRRRLEDLLLLLLRCLLLAVAVGALAGPRLKGTRFDAGLAELEAEREALAVVLDDSPSVSLRREAGGAALWPRLLRSLEALLAERRATSSVGIETAAGRGWPGAADAPAPLARGSWLVARGSWLDGSMTRWLDDSVGAPAFASGDRTAALGRALALLKDATEDRRVVLLVTDFGRNEEEGAGAAGLGRWNAALRAFREPGAPVLLAVDVACPAGQQWSVEELAPAGVTPAGRLEAGGWRPEERQPVVSGQRSVVSDSTKVAGHYPLTTSHCLVAGEPFLLRAAVRCRAGGGTRKLRVTSAALHEEGGERLGPWRVLLEQALALAPGEMAELSVPVLAAAPGALLVKAELEGADERPYDDDAETVVSVHPKRRVVLCDLRPRAGEDGPARQGDAVASLAAPDKALLATLTGLDPLAGAEASRVRLERASPGGTLEFGPGTLVVALHDPHGPALGPEQSERLARAVEDGATLVWIPDLTGAPEQWPRPLPGRAVVADPLLPRALEGAEEWARASSAASGLQPPASSLSGWRVADAGTSHPLLRRPFSGGRNGDLEGIKFKRRLRLALEAAVGPTLLSGAAMARPSGKPDLTLAHFDDGQPALVWQPLGAGGIYQMALGVEPEGGLIASAAWPVLLAELIELAAADAFGDAPAPKVVAGAPAPPWPLAATGRASGWIIEGPFRFEYLLDRPTAARAPLRRWEIEVTGERAEVRLPVFAEPGLYRVRRREGGTERWLGVRISAYESDIAGLPAELAERLAQAAADSGGAFVRGLPALPQALARLRPGRPLAPLLWTLFGLAMAFELGLQVWRRRLG